MNLTLHALSDDWALNADKTQSLHALSDDWKLTAGAYAKGIISIMYVEDFLVDNDGNFLVDTNGNYLVTAGTETQVTTSLHALADDWSLNG